MGNCCGVSPKISDSANTTQNTLSVEKTITVLSDPTGTDIGASYELGHELGHGGFGVTYLCTERSTGMKYACKSISKKKLRTGIEIEDVRTEAAIMQCLPKHPNIVALKDTFEDDRSVHLVMELCQGGELSNRIKARGYYTERDAAVVAKTVVQVVQWCHKHRVMHRDLKLENFLFANKGERFQEIVGSRHYMAPELFERNYGPEIDIWSAGAIIYILLCGFPPFSADTKEGVVEAIVQSVVEFRKDPWLTVSDHAKDFVKKMLERDPKKRLTAQEALDHPWLRDAEKEPEVSPENSSCTVINSQDGKGNGAENM